MARSAAASRPHALAGGFASLPRRLVSAVARLEQRSGAPLRYVPIASAQVAGVSYTNIGDAGLEFLEDWADSGARACVPAFMNPAGVDLVRWRELGVSESFALKQQRIVAALERMGVAPSLTCAPYEGYVRLAQGDHLAWSESSAVSCANSLFGARTNREGGPSALAAAICGETACTGYHLERHRRATHVVRVACPLRSVADYGALGLLVGAQVQGGVPYLAPASPSGWPRAPMTTGLRALAAAMAASGAVALFHVHGVTPEAAQAAGDLLGLPEVAVADLAPGYALASNGAGPLDAVAIGCPHASLDEVKEVAALLRGRKLSVPLWLTTSRRVAGEAERLGLRAHVEAAGARLLSDMCLLVAPLAEMGIRRIATNSAKTAYYLRSREAMGVALGSTEQCVQSAVAGEWREDRLPSAAPAPPAAPPPPRHPLSACAVVEGRVRGEALCSSQPIGFFGHVDPGSGVITEPGHELRGRSIAGKVLIFPRAKGSTVGSYVLYALKKAGRAPLAIINRDMEPIVAAGAVIADIVAVDGVETGGFHTGQLVEVSGAEVRVV